MDFIIDPEFKARNRPHTKAEREVLEKLIDRDGCADGALTVSQIEGDPEKRLIDGHSTHEICTAKKLPMTEPRLLLFPDRASVLDWIDKKQFGRRNLTPKELQARHKARIKRVAKARRQGKSTRTIAKEEGVSQPQVVKDIREAGDNGLSPERGKVTGKDGKKYEASKPASGLPGPEIPDRLKNRGLVQQPPERSAIYVRAENLVHAIREVHENLREACGCSEGLLRKQLEAAQKKLRLVDADIDLALNPASAPTKEQRNELFDAVVSITGSDPKVSGSHVAKVVKLLLKAEPPYSAADVLRLPEEFKKAGWKTSRVTVGMVEKYIGWVRNECQGSGLFDGIKEFLRRHAS